MNDERPEQGPGRSAGESRPGSRPAPGEGADREKAKEQREGPARRGPVKPRRGEANRRGEADRGNGYGRSADPRRAGGSGNSDRRNPGPRPRTDRGSGGGEARAPTGRGFGPSGRNPRGPGRSGPGRLRSGAERFGSGSERPGPAPGRPGSGSAGRNSGRTSRSARRYGDPRSPQRGKDPRAGGHPNRIETEEKFIFPDNPREAALRILHDVDTRGMFSDRLLDGAHSRGGWDPRDQALLHELVKGTLRWRGRIDSVLDSIVHIGILQVQPWVRNVLRMGAYQVLFLDRIPPHAAVDESVKLANTYGHPGTAGLANSVMRRLVDEKDTFVLPQGDDEESLAAWGSHPRWIVERWLARFGPEATRALLTANNRHVPVGLRVNALRGTREQLIERLAAEGVAARPAVFSPDLVWIDAQHPPGRLAAFKQGWCTAQDESECLVGRLVAPQPHERLLDLCAAPGGKCTHLAELMGDEGEVWAMERAAERVQSLENAIARLGTHSIHAVQGDGRSYAFPMPFDRVLVDAPCSGLGVLGRRADARWRKTPDILREMPPIQLDLLTAAGRRLRPGGVLVYSVCSFEPEETTHLVERFLRANPAFVHEAANGLLPDPVVDENGFMSVLPHIHGCDGAFAARFRKT
ncbi:MAG: 16S rRNA (cytosine(967)-C(5))-methyltransferase RsmB [Candidatus Eisenbacteria bacterium]|uniref:16S rRNA (cytosine(967)-C(5))-methyltransferase n=1 Tax=Eiseniibacteriota bacterium TaxID=2212470 RepID=A0A538U7Z5_UNCEI|nr:MAG: 16S rRNA (cytosine(967)-C(5))-methyltransferase RsmB [Candidatus Eisenbacteria bacterium]